MLTTLVLIATPSFVRGDGARPPTFTPAAVGLEVFAAGCGLVPTHGSAVALGRHLVATVAHVVAGSTDVVVVEPNGETHLAEIVALDTRRDAAVLRANTLERPPLTFGALGPGEQATYLGFGGRHRNTVVPLVVERPVSILSEDIYLKGEYPRPGYQVRGDVVSGDSGAGVLSATGRFAALVWAADREADASGFAVSSRVIADLLATVGPQPAAAVPCG